MTLIVPRFKSSHQRCSVRKSVLRNFTKFTGKHMCQTLFFSKVAGTELCHCYSKNNLLFSQVIASSLFLHESKCIFSYLIHFFSDIDETFNQELSYNPLFSGSCFTKYLYCKKMKLLHNY